MSLKKAAEELLQVADDIEAQADQVTQFVCASCNHTATLETINTRRKEAAEGVDGEVQVAKVTVNDSVACPACGGTMAYSPTEASEQFYFDPDKQAGDDAEEEDDDESTDASKKASGPIDYDNLKRYRA